jgi:ATP-dependent Lon protease
MADFPIRASGEEEGQEHRPVGFEEDPANVQVPTELPILPLRGVVIFPSAIVPLLISRGSSLKLVEDCLKGDRILGLAAQKNAEDENPDPNALFSRGSAGRILKMLKYPDGSVRILVQGIQRIEIREYFQYDPYLRAKIALLPDSVQDTKDLGALQAHMVSQFSKFVSLVPYLPDELQGVVMNIKDPARVSDLVASQLNISSDEKQDLLNTLEVRARLEKLSAILNREIELVELGHKIQSQVQTELNKNQKEFYLRQQIRAIQK